MFNQLYCSGADVQYNRFRSDFSLLYNRLNAEIRRSTSISYEARVKRTVEVLKLPKPAYYPCLFLHGDFWKTGRLSRNIVLKPLDKMPIFTTASNVGLNCIVGPSGTGKSTLMADFVGYSVESKGMFVFNVLGDEANSLTLSCLPLFPMGGNTGLFLRKLKGMRVKPKPLPCVNLTFLRDEDELKKMNYKSSLAANPATVFDRVVWVRDTQSFGFEFETGKKADVESVDSIGNRGVLNVLEEFALKLGYKRACGIVNVRNLRRLEHPDKNTTIRPDVQIATYLIDKFAKYRQSSKTPEAIILADELSYLAPVVHAIAGSDTSKSSAMVSEAIKQARKLNTTVVGATQKYNEVNPEARSEAFNIFFRGLPKSKDKSKSQRDIVLGSLDLKDGKVEEETVASAMERGIFPYKRFLWYWWNKLRKTVEVVQPSPPFFMVNQPRKSNLEVFKAYEKFSGEQVLLKDWSEVPQLRYRNTEYFEKGFVAAL